jgi:acyl transferase domain-containing protein
MPNPSSDRAIAIVGVGAILPDALSAPAFWQNIVNRRYCISETPANRWSITDYYDPDPAAPDKSYSKIGGWVQGYQFDWKKYRIPPKVAAAMDEGQQWAVTIADEALADYGYPHRPLDTERTGVILGTAMGGELHYVTQNRVAFPEFARELAAAPGFASLPAAQREAILQQWRDRINAKLPPITEDTMPGELPNIVAGRVANVLNLRGANFITDAACASSFAAINVAFEMLTKHHIDAVIAGGVDRNMGAPIFVKFCKIGALSATGSRPFGDGADGFVMGEGSASFLLKRLSDAERDGDKIYAVIRGVGASSDGKGKGITAPNPQGQVLSATRAWENAGLDPATATLLEAHGTSTKVGDVVEVESLTKVFGDAARHSIGLGSAKSNIGHLKAGAGAAGLLKATMAIHHKLLPPTLNCERPNPNIDFANSPFYLLREPRAWEQPRNAPRRAGVSAYGFGGTNFHLVLEEYVPGMLKAEPKLFAAAAVNGGQSVPVAASTPPAPISQTTSQPMNKKPLRGILSVGATTPTELKDKLDDLFRRVEAGWSPERQAPSKADIKAPERLFIDFGTQEELLDRISKARKAAGFDNPQAWKALQGQGIFRGSGPKPGKIAFLFPGQGSQYTNMGGLLAQREPVVAQVFKDADVVMKPILGKPLTSYIFVDGQDAEAMKKAERDLMQTAITQPAMLTMDTAIYKLLSEYGFGPDMVMGHSLGEYAALIAAGIMPFAHALEASAARGAEMTKVSMDDNGWMAAVMAPLDVVEATLQEVDGYIVAANINSYNQAVVGGASKAVEQAISLFEKKGFRAMRIPVSHAFHTKIVAPASGPLRKVLDRLSISSPKIPLVANVTGDIYPTGIEAIKDILELQIASPVQWVKGLETMYREGVRCFVEVGPKRALKGFVDDVLGSKPDVWSLLTNHPKNGEIESFNQALCGLYAAGYGAEGRVESTPVVVASPAPVQAEVKESATMSQSTADPNSALGQALLQTLQQLAAPRHSQLAYDRNDVQAGSVVITGTGLGLPGANKPVMAPDNAMRILRGEQFVDLIPERFRKQMAGKRITRVVKGDDGSGRFEVIEETDDVIKLAGRGGYFDLTEEYGVPAKLIEALDITTQLSIAAGLDALREAGIPLVQSYRPTSKGTYLPDRWLLPEALRDETGVIFASAFPGGDRMADDFRRYYEWENRRQQLAALEDLRQYTTDATTLREIMRRIGELKDELDKNPYEFDRRFIFRILAMGHSQFAEYIGARGPNTHVNAACASTAQGVALAEDWIRNGRCRRVIVVGADDVTSENLMGWVGAGFLATGAAATDDKVEEAALPFDRRRHGTLLGMGACALVVESEDTARARGMRGIVELLSGETANSAFHGTRLDVNHISDVMNRLVTAAERRFGLNRYTMAPQMAFISHETFTPARGGSASAEVTALRSTFGEATDEIVVCNTKGFTGHPMGAGVEDVIAVKILEHGIVPPVPNYKEVDPDLGVLNLSRGGRYPVQYALHLAAGFGSQIAMTLIRRIPGSHDRVDNKARYQRWLADVSGYDRAETEVVKRVLRIVAQGQPTRTPIASDWQYGSGPVVRAAAPGDGVMTDYRPLPMPAVAAAVRGEVVVPVSIAPAPVAPPKPAAPAPVPAPAPKVAEPIAPPPAPAAAAPVAAAPVAQVPISQSPAVDPVVTQVLEVVAAKTGYPQDMLDLDLDLEADLGIDTVKQAETFAAIRETFAIPVQEGLNLREYSTLASVVGFVRKNRPDLAVASQPAVLSPVPAVAAAPAAQSPISQSPVADVVVSQVLDVVANKTGYPRTCSISTSIWKLTWASIR